MNEQNPSPEPPGSSVSGPAGPPEPPPPPPPPKPRGRSPLALTAAALAVVGALVALGITLGRDGEDLTEAVAAASEEQLQRAVEESDDLSIDPETGGVGIEIPPVGGGEHVVAPEPGAPDRHREPVSCNSFSPAVLAQLGGEVEPTEGIPAGSDHEHVSWRCSFDGAAVTTFTFEPTGDGDGTAAVWEAFGFDLRSYYGIPDLGDGAGLQEDNCALFVADSNLAVWMTGDGGDPRTCGDYLTGLAEDLLSELDR